MSYNIGVFAPDGVSVALTYVSARITEFDSKEFILEDHATYVKGGPGSVVGLKRQLVHYLIHRDMKSVLIQMGEAFKSPTPSPSGSSIVAVRLSGEVVPDHDMIIEFLFDAGLIGGKHFAHVTSIPVLRTFLDPDSDEENHEWTRLTNTNYGSTNG